VQPSATIPQAEQPHTTPTPSPTRMTTTPTATAAPVALPIATVKPSASPPVPVKGEIARGNASTARLALTFDAGSGALATPAILAALRDKGVKSTIFLTGQWVEKYPSPLRQMAQDGHEFGNHSYSHPDFTTLSTAEIESQLARTENLVRATIGGTTKPFFRPPFGARDNRVIGVVESLGYRSIYWTLDSGDWREDATPEGVFGRVTGNASAGAIIVMHVDSQATAKCLPELIDALRAQGYSLVELSELLAR